MLLLLVVAALLFRPSKADFINNLRPHSIDSLKLKCDALPFRSSYVDNRCFFAIMRKVKYSEALALCAQKFSGAQVALNAIGVHKLIMVDETKFHDDANSTEVKNTICVFKGGYKCDQGYSLVRRKCAFPAKKEMSFADARKYCKKLALELPSPENDLENQILADQLVAKEPVWIQKTLDKKSNKFVWSIGKNYGRFTTCDGSSMKLKMYSGSQSTSCNAAMTSVVDKTGYWSNVDQQNEMNVVCTKDARNEFTQEPPKKVVVEVDGPCAPLHELNEDTGRCEWVGANDACAALMDTWNNTWFISMKGRFPTFINAEECLQTTTNTQFNDATTAVVVRRGCMFTGYAHPITGNWYQEVKLVENVLYGIHKVPNYCTTDPVRTVPTYLDGLTRASCVCDPTEATVNGHVPSPPRTKDLKYCAEISTNDNRNQFLEIPNWPEKRKYDVNHWTTRNHLHFHVQVVSIIVRQHCFATLYWREFHEWKTLPTSGYGKYVIPAFFNGLTHHGVGTARFVCECIR